MALPAGTERTGIPMRSARRGDARTENLPLSISPSPSSLGASFRNRLSSASSGSTSTRATMANATPAAPPAIKVEGFATTHDDPPAARRNSMDGAPRPRASSSETAKDAASLLAPRSPTRSLLSEQIAHNADDGHAVTTATDDAALTTFDHPLVKGAHRLARACAHDASLAAAAANLDILESANTAHIPIPELGAAAAILDDLGVDAATVAAGMLTSGAHANHARLRMGDSHLAEVTSDEVAQLVANITHMAEVSARIRSRAEQLDDEVHLEKSRTLFLAMADVRVCLAFLADRLATLRRLATVRTLAEPDHPVASSPRETELAGEPGTGTSPEGASKSGKRRHRNDGLKLEQKLYVLESLRVFAPIANRLGIWKWKAELEDLCFQLLYPDQYANLRSRIDSSKDASQIGAYMERVRDVLDSSVIRFASIKGRPKNLYSVWNKLSAKRIALSDVHDVMAMRVVVHRTGDCYRTLELVHELFEPVPGKLKDYIRSPKENGYRSLHTVVSDGKGGTFEVQVRTEEMHREAELGVAAHWRYKEDGHAAKAAANKAGFLASSSRLATSPPTADPSLFGAGDLAYSDLSSGEESEDGGAEPLEVAFRRVADAMARRKKARRQRRARRAQRRFAERAIEHARFCVTAARDAASAGGDYDAEGVETEPPSDMVFAVVADANGTEVRVVALGAGGTVGQALERTGAALGAGDAVTVRVNGFPAQMHQELASGDVVEVGEASPMLAGL